MTTTINASTTAGLVQTADTSGSLQLQTANTAALTIDSSQNITTTGNIRLNNSTADGAQVIFASSGYSDWNIDNYSGRLRAYYNATEYFTIDTSGNVGIGTSSPNGKTQANAGSSQVAFMAGGTVNNPQYPAFGFDGQIFSNGGRGAGMYLPADGTLAWATAATERMRIDSSGRVTTPYQPMFSGYRASGTTVSATNAIIHNQVFVNVGSHYDTSNGRFTAPIAGYYEVIIFAHAENSTPINCAIYKNGSNIMSAYQGGAAYGRVGNTAILSLAAGDYIQHYITYGTVWTGDLSGASMSVKLIG